MNLHSSSKIKFIQIHNVFCFSKYISFFNLHELIREKLFSCFKDLQFEWNEFNLLFLLKIVSKIKN